MSTPQYARSPFQRFFDYLLNCPSFQATFILLLHCDIFCREDIPIAISWAILPSRRSHRYPSTLMEPENRKDCVEWQNSSYSENCELVRQHIGITPVCWSRLQILGLATILYCYTEESSQHARAVRDTHRPHRDQDVYFGRFPYRMDREALCRVPEAAICESELESH
jgi:hypothetical protein